MTRKRRLKRLCSVRGFVVVYAPKKPAKAVESACEPAWQRYRHVEASLPPRPQPVIQPQPKADEEDALMMSLFLDFAVKDLLDNPSNLEFYTEEMAAEDDELLAGVLIDED